MTLQIFCMIPRLARYEPMQINLSKFYSWCQHVDWMSHSDVLKLRKQCSQLFWPRPYRDEYRESSCAISCQRLAIIAAFTKNVIWLKTSSCWSLLVKIRGSLCDTLATLSNDSSLVCVKISDMQLQITRKYSDECFELHLNRVYTCLHSVSTMARSNEVCDFLKFQSSF